jgi:hypothetical protein
MGDLVSVAHKRFTDKHPINLSHIAPLWTARI